MHVTGDHLNAPLKYYKSNYTKSLVGFFVLFLFLFILILIEPRGKITVLDLKAFHTFVCFKASFGFL